MDLNNIYCIYMNGSHYFVYECLDAYREHVALLLCAFSWSHPPSSLMAVVGPRCLSSQSDYFLRSSGLSQIIFTFTLSCKAF